MIPIAASKLPFDVFQGRLCLEMLQFPQYEAVVNLLTYFTTVDLRFTEVNGCV